MGKYDALTKEVLVRQMEAHDRREASRYGKVAVLHREGGVEWHVVRLAAKSQRPSLGDTLRLAEPSRVGAVTNGYFSRCKHANAG